jgi:hypothetical protein
MIVALSSSAWTRLLVELVKVSSQDVRNAVAAIFTDCVTPVLFPAQAVRQGGGGEPVLLPADAIPRELPDSLAPPPPPPPVGDA